jgi:hypothetical protein
VVKTHTSGGLVAHHSQATMLGHSLTGDTQLGIDYSC